MTEYVERELVTVRNLTSRLEDEVWWWTRGSINRQMAAPPSLNLNLHRPRLVSPSHFASAWAQLARRR